MLLGVLSLEVQRRADNKREVFMTRFLRIMDSRPSIKANQLIEWFLHHKVSTVPRLQYLKAHSPDPDNWSKLFDRYLTLLTRMGYYTDGSGGPRFLRDMSEQEIGAIYSELVIVTPLLQREVNRTRHKLNFANLYIGYPPVRKRESISDDPERYRQPAHSREAIPQEEARQDQDWLGEAQGDPIPAVI